MCEYCESKYTAKGGFFGKHITISKCASETPLTRCQVVKCLGDEQFSIIILECCTAMGYFNINYCPMCGRDLRGKSENE